MHVIETHDVPVSSQSQECVTDDGCAAPSVCSAEHPESVELPAEHQRSDASDAELTEAESTDGEGTEESDCGESELSEDEDFGDGKEVKADISSLAQVEDASSPGDEDVSHGRAVAETQPPSPQSSYPDENLPPKTGIPVPMVTVSPDFIRAVPQDPELLYSAPESLFDDVVKLEADRISKPELVQNLIVYDSVEPPPSAFVSEQGMDACCGGQLGLGTSSLSAVTSSLIAAAATDVAPEVSCVGSAPPTQPRLQETPEITPTGSKGEALPTYYVPVGPQDTTLVFESRFEGGNLRRAVKVYDFEYDLVLNPDYNTKANTQWYFFRCANTRKGCEYRFNIINMAKPTSVYNEGMRPLMYSTIEAAQGVGWVRGSENIIYYQNGIRRKDKGGTTYYTLTFTTQFKHDVDIVYFAHCYPYSYTDLQTDLRKLETDPNMSRRFRRRKLCDTLAGNACDLITITSFCSDPAAIRSRRAVVITARVHPGESNASWVMKGMLDYLTGPSLDARILRDNFVFKIVPMLNPDGVIVGNYRCSLVGHDLNRQWGEPSRKLHPTIYFTKNMFKHLLDDREVVLYVDIHGHSRKKNVFMYGNCESPGLKEKIFPRLLCRSSDCFSFDDCCFKMQKSKDSTARVVAYRELAVTNSFTLEASFCGADFGPLGDQHFTTRHLEEMGCMVCDAILDFCDPDQTKVLLVYKELQVLFPDDGNSDDVSDSDVDEAALRRARRRAAKLKLKKEKPKKKKKKKRTRKPSPEASGSVSIGKGLAAKGTSDEGCSKRHVEASGGDGKPPCRSGAVSSATGAAASASGWTTLATATATSGAAADADGAAADTEIDLVGHGHAAGLTSGRGASRRATSTDARGGDADTVRSRRGGSTSGGTGIVRRKKRKEREKVAPQLPPRASVASDDHCSHPITQLADDVGAAGGKGARRFNSVRCHAGGKGGTSGATGSGGPSSS
eukprot:TRINITY_DN55630_c0_g1_i1.p1 TRINITY_DN55630_c0_g1~~TRINITY_DN55630_c0_g1_i1.p1  ORF type:complete len:955 (-),score=174.64 TRINITY_DN55630_c0_g1_i1:177-3041(-)